MCVTHVHAHDSINECARDARVRVHACVCNTFLYTRANEHVCMQRRCDAYVNAEVYIRVCIFVCARSCVCVCIGAYVRVRVSIYVTRLRARSCVCVRAHTYAGACAGT